MVVERIVAELAVAGGSSSENLGWLDPHRKHYTKAALEAAAQRTGAVDMLFFWT